jgi:hypothetical protein
MSNRAIGILSVCVVLGDCAGARGPLKGPTIEPVNTHVQASASSRIRGVTNLSSRLQSVLLLPVEVEILVAADPVALNRVSVGALFARHAVGTPEVAGLVLVFQAVGGGLGAALSVRPTLEIVVDGVAVTEGPVFDARLYNIALGPGGRIETVMVSVLPVLLDRIAQAAEVEVVLGDPMRLALDRHERSGFRELLGEIPADTDFGVCPRAPARREFITD